MSLPGQAAPGARDTANGGIHAAGVAMGHDKLKSYGIVNHVVRCD
jgi:hypothetical protein